MGRRQNCGIELLRRLQGPPVIPGQLVWATQQVVAALAFLGEHDRTEDLLPATEVQFDRGHLVAAGPELRHCGYHCFGDVDLDRASLGLGTPGDPVPGQTSRAMRAHAILVLGGHAGQHRVQGVGIGDTTSKRPRRDERAEGAEPPVVVDGPEGRLESHEAAERCGDADGAAAVGPEAHGAGARSHRGRRAAARPAGCAARVEGICGVGAEQVVGRGRLAELRDVCLADEDCSGAAQAAHSPRVVAGHVVGVRERAERGDVTFDVERVLDRDRHAGQRAGGAVPVRRLGLDGLAARQLRGRQNVGVQRGVHLGDPRQSQLANLRR